MKDFLEKYLFWRKRDARGLLRRNTCNPYIVWLMIVLIVLILVTIFAFLF